MIDMFFYALCAGGTWWFVAGVRRWWIEHRELRKFKKELEDIRSL